jgi:hypothetical protein
MNTTVPEKYLIHVARLQSVINKKGSPRVTRTPLTQCWTHTTAPSSNGYGQIMINKQTWNLHRLSWFLANSYPESEEHPFWDSHKFHVAHLCDNKECANPEHLELQPAKKNIQDGVELREEKSAKPAKEVLRNSEPCLNCVEKHKSCDGGIPCDRCTEMNLECVKKEYKTHSGSFQKGAGKGADNIKARLTPEQVIEIRRRHKAGLKYGELKKMTEEYDVSYATLQAIVGGRIWDSPEYYPL